MKATLKTALAMAALVLATQAAAQITFFQNEGFGGRSITSQSQIQSFGGTGLNNSASSAVVRGQRWEVCQGPRFAGPCVVLRPGQYPSLAAMGLNNSVSSARAVDRNARFDDSRYAPPPQFAYDYGRRNNERLYQANVTSVRAVVGTPAQRCWIEREQVVQQERSGPNVGGAVIGAVLGGILGHQIGSGSGRDAATAVGVVGGAAVGANVGRSGGQQVVTQDVQRCTSTQTQMRPDYYDVTYSFRGQVYRMQTTTAPGAHVTVNQQGEPRA
jgi:uncharacterized protein YcfJ